MKSILSNVFIFAVGAAIGSAVTWKFVKTKYERIAQEEIDSVKEVFGRRRDTNIVEDDIEEVTEADDKKVVEEIITSAGYVNYSKFDKSEVKNVTNNTNEKKPYVIPPDEFDELDGYEVISLTYYADGVLTDDYNEPIEDVEATVGRDSLTHFGEYEDDSVFVRNDTLMIDYEILADMRNYSDVVKNSPHRAEEA